MNKTNIPYLLRDKSSNIEAEKHLSDLFESIDINKDQELTKEEFINGLKEMTFVDISKIEAIRLFESIDIDDSNTITLNEFVQAAKHIRWIRTLAKVFAASRAYNFIVPDNYDYTKTTKENYKRNDKLFFGEYHDIRETREYDYHGNYTQERQEWQDRAIKSCLGRTESQPRPWVVFTCGPMGVGKGHVLSWLSSQGLFPLEFIVHIDPDFFKRIMPEWNTYVQKDVENAGSFCHLESGYLQEIAQEVAMRQRQHVWIDGSLSNGDWFSTYFDYIRENFPHYRIAIFYIHAPESTIRQRIAKRTNETGRSIPESQILRSLISPEESLRKLARKTDLVVRIKNDTCIELESVEDYTGNWHGALGRYFGTISLQPSLFPISLGPFYLEPTSFHANALLPINDSSIESILYLNIDSGDWEKLWFELNSNGNLLAYRLTQSGKFENIHTWNIDENVTIEEISLPSLSHLSPQSLVVPFSKKRNYDTTFQTIPEIEEQVTFQIKFQSPTSIQIIDTLDHDIISPILSNKISIILAAIDYNSKVEWIEKLKLHTKKKNNRNNNENNNNNNNNTDSDTDIDSDNEPSPILKKNPSTIFYRSDTGTTINRRMMSIPSQQYEQLKISPLHCQTSPSIVQLLWNLGKPLILTGSPKYKVDGKREELELSGTPHSATHSRYTFPTDVSNLNLDSPHMIPTDPDVLFLRWGGFIHYDSNGSILNVMVMSRIDQKYFIQYGEPEPLHPDDVKRLTILNRWKKITRPELIEGGAKYFSFICPREQLATRPFPLYGTFAYIFHEPYELHDERDCFFSPLLSI